MRSPTRVLPFGHWMTTGIPRNSVECIFGSLSAVMDFMVLLEKWCVPAKIPSTLIRVALPSFRYYSSGDFTSICEKKPMYSCEQCGTQVQTQGGGRWCAACRKFCRVCGADVGGRPVRLCAACTSKLGICTTCKYRPQDRPGYKECRACSEVRRKKADLQFTRVGSRSRIAEWKVRSIEECRQAAAEIRAKFVTGDKS